MSALVAAEAAEAPARVAGSLARNRRDIAMLAERLAVAPPRLLLTCARGSSDAAARWLRSLIEIRLGWPGGSISPSTVSTYGVDLELEGALVVLVSQSGMGPDLLAVAEHARRRSAFTVGLVNDEGSPLAGAVDVLLPLAVGAERSVAATKSCLAAMALGLAFVEECRIGSADAVAAALPSHLAASASLDWSGLATALADASSAYVVARGPGLAIAVEAALKLKETAGIHAEAVSAAELLHGPVALAGPAMPALLFAARDQARASVGQAAARLRARGAPTICAGLREHATVVLPDRGAADPAVELLGRLQAFYGALAGLALGRGRDPDAPPGLAKVTMTR